MANYPSYHNINVLTGAPLNRERGTSQDDPRKFRPGFEPVEYRCLVLPDETETKTAGGIIIPDETADREKHAQVKGTLISFGAIAFDGWGEDRERMRQSGVRVIYAKYAGNEIKGVDGRTYRQIYDKDIGARIVE